ncbi:hypothetical protein CDL15_Pgr016008 [Punica granatum]|uniref:Exopolygalacturonase-like n=1 Tax=Punica granatum TaxID=22663 RepID=A0A218XRU2_PUNGR|nr:hypothetical protein CDL15_Pgr016008 [Punica granatum]
MDSRSLSCKSCIVVIFLLLLINDVRAYIPTKRFNVEAFGAVGNGRTDSSKAFLYAFTRACQFNGYSILLVPKGTFLVGPVVFKGPCRGPIDFQLRGIMRAPAGAVGMDHWISFRYIDRLMIYGGGILDGRGETAWHYNDCSRNSNCQSLPVSLRLDFVTNSVVRGITSLNSKNFHMNIMGCTNLRMERLHIIAPAESPNTDGVHLGYSEHIRISDSIIATGDDCISLGPGSKNIEVLGVTCGPGHGISIGSLGKYQNELDVSGIKVRNCVLDGTDNGLRIKTWATSLKSKVHDITFEDVIMNNVYNPIFIDQQYCPGGNCDNSKASSVQIQDVMFRRIRGTSKSQAAVNLRCSRLYPCKNIKLADINLSYKGPANTTCLNVQASAWGLQKPDLGACI